MDTLEPSAGRGLDAGHAAPGAGGLPAFGLPDFLDVLRRRWLTVTITAAAVLAVIGWQQQRELPRYSAQILLRKERPEVTLPGVLGGASTREAMASELEILRSRSVLTAVVDSVGLRLVLADRRTPRSRIVAEARVMPEASEARYALTHERGMLHLRDSENAERATGRPGEWIAGPGFRLMVDSAAALRNEVRFAIVAYEDALRTMRDELVVHPIEGTNLLRVRYTSSDPRLAAAVANALAAAYRGYSADQQRADAQRRREFIARQLAALADSMAAAQQALLENQRSARMLDPRMEGEALGTALVEAQSELRTLRFQESLLTTLLLSLQSQGPSNEAFQRLVAMGRDILPGAEALYNRLQTLETDRQRLTAARYGQTAQGPEVQVLDSLIAATRTEAKGISEESLRLLGTRRSAAETRVQELQGRVGTLPLQAMTFARLQQRVDAVQNIFDLLVEKFYEALIPEAVATGGVEVVDSATVPARPDRRPGRSRLAFALVVGLALGVGLAFGLEHLDTTVRYPWEAESAARLQVVGMVPDLKMPTSPAASLPLAGDDASPGAEAFRMIRTTLRFVRPQRPQVIEVTSPAPGEGKSVIAANLALALGQQGGRVLAIDADLRHPTLHTVFGTERAPGLSDLLVGDADPTRAIRALAAGGVSVLAAGTGTRTPAELLGSEAFAALVRDARNRFDTIIIDTPPVLSAADAAVIAPLADGILVVARVGHTHRFALTRTVEQLHRTKGVLLGVVLNRVPPGGPYGQYGYYYGYESEHSKEHGSFGVLAKLLRRKR